MDRNKIAVYFSDEELTKLEEVRKYSVLNSTALFKVLIKNGLDEMEKSEKLVFSFDKNKKVNRPSSGKPKIFQLDEQQSAALDQICSATPFSRSALAKYFIMPQIDAIIDRKGWEYRP